jgi:hypothetical protein
MVKNGQEVVSRANRIFQPTEEYEKERWEDKDNTRASCLIKELPVTEMRITSSCFENVA